MWGLKTLELDFQELTENNPAHRPYLKHEEKELRTTLQMLENAIEEKQVEEIAVRWVFKLKLASDWLTQRPI